MSLCQDLENGEDLIIAIIGVILLIALLESLLEIIIPLQLLSVVLIWRLLFGNQAITLRKVNTKTTYSRLKR